MSYIMSVQLVPPAIRVSPRRTWEAIPASPDDPPPTGTMAPHLAQFQRAQLYNMTRSSSLHDGKIADIASCSKRTFTRARANMRAFGTLWAPKVTNGQRSRILSHMLEALLDHLLPKPGLYLDEIADFIWEE
jgi:hypothetical protein